MTIQITKTAKQGRIIHPRGWHVCGNNGCQNAVFGLKSVCLRCWAIHLQAHGDRISAEYKYFEESL